MTTTAKYLNFIKEKGRPLSEINLGSEEVALTVKDALQALELLKDIQIIVLGGDILSEDENGRIVYAIHIWGYNYHYLNWYCDKADNENKTEYLQRSYDIARTSIENASKVAEKLKKKCLIVLVI